MKTVNWLTGMMALPALALTTACMSTAPLSGLQATGTAADLNLVPRQAFRTIFVEEDEQQELGVLGVVALQPVDGRVAICGTAKQVGALPSDVGREILSDYELEIDGDVIVRDFSRFAWVNTEPELLSTPAPCSLSQTPWQESYATAEWVMDLAGDRAYDF